MFLGAIAFFVNGVFKPVQRLEVEFDLGGLPDQLIRPIQHLLRYTCLGGLLLSVPHHIMD
jgi:hypothetical protein